MSVPQYITDPDSVFAGVSEDDLRQKPNYANAERTYLSEKKNDHQEGSLAWIAHQLVRALEKEASHKKNPEHWTTIDNEKFKWSTNGGPTHTAAEVAAKGSYNTLIGENAYYSAKEHSWQASHDA
jgi:hypothetical protein